MNPIQKLHINYFKFFTDNSPIEVNGKHLLIYGENGSGKSSLYWALYTLLETVYKTDTQQNKYFAPTSEPESLLNLNTPSPNDAFVSLELADGKNYRLALGDYSIRTDNKEAAEATSRASDFLNYRFMFRLIDFRHRDEIDLFSLFEKDVFPYIKTRNTFQLIHDSTPSNDFNEIWYDLLKGPKQPTIFEGPTPVPTPTPTTTINVGQFQKEYADNLRKFVVEINILAQEINIIGNEILQNDLGYSSIRIEVVCSQKFQNLGGDGDLTGRESDYPIGFPKIKLLIPDYEGNAISRPQSFLNEAKLTAIGIAIRFAILTRRLDYADGADFQLLVLDDLLISLDMSNRDLVLKLLLDKYASNYQLLILTHDAHFAQLVQHKIKAKGQSSDWLRYDMYEDLTAHKPFITQNIRYVERARVHYNQMDYEASGNYLRKEAEDFCKRFLPKRRQLGGDFEPKDLNGLIISCKDYANQCGLSEAPFKALDQHRKFIFNILSHDAYDVPRFRKELENAFNTFKELDKLQFQEILPSEQVLVFEMNDENHLWRIEITIYEPLILIKEGSKSSVLGKVFTNYQIHKDGQKFKGLCHEYLNIADLYKKWWENSNKAKNQDFWEEITNLRGTKKLKELRLF